MKKKLIVFLIFLILALIIIPESLALFNGEIPITGQIEMAPQPVSDPPASESE